MLIIYRVRATVRKEIVMSVRENDKVGAILLECSDHIPVGCDGCKGKRYMMPDILQKKGATTAPFSRIVFSERPLLKIRVQQVMCLL